MTGNSLLNFKDYAERRLQECERDRDAALMLSKIGTTSGDRRKARALLRAFDARVATYRSALTALAEYTESL